MECIYEFSADSGTALPSRSGDRPQHQTRRNAVPTDNSNIISETSAMKQIFAVLFATATVFAAVSSADAGCLFCRRDCEECPPTCAAPATCAAPVASCCQPEPDCACPAVASACCGMACCGGVGQLGAMYGYMTGPRGLTGYEGLPNMDGRGVHGRYPYHSYRRPWFHPGPKSANVTIVW